MKKIKINDKSHKYIKRIAKIRKKTMSNIIDFIIDVFQQIPIHAITPPPGPIEPYMTYKIAYYEQNKYKLEDYQREFFEKSKDHMKVFYDAHKKELLSFKVTYALIRKRNNKEILKKYNRQYYLNRKG